jgi:hypothetical protein
MNKEYWENAKSEAFWITKTDSGYAFIRSDGLEKFPGSFFQSEKEAKDFCAKKEGISSYDQIPRVNI